MGAYFLLEALGDRIFCSPIQPALALYQHDAHTPVKPCVQLVSPQVHVMRNPHVGSVIGQEHDGSKRPAGLHREEVASYGKNLDLLQPRDMEPNCMQTTCMATCPSAKHITPPFQDMYYLEKNNDALHSAPTQTKQPF